MESRVRVCVTTVKAASGLTVVGLIGMELCLIERSVPVDRNKECGIVSSSSLHPTHHANITLVYFRVALLLP